MSVVGRCLLFREQEAQFLVSPMGFLLNCSNRQSRELSNLPKAELIHLKHGEYFTLALRQSSHEHS